MTSSRLEPGIAYAPVGCRAMAAAQPFAADRAKTARCTVDADGIAKALGGRKAGNGWIARCPGHDDRKPSLSLTSTDEGRLLVRCHAGCDQQRVVAALRAKGLWPETGKFDALAYRPAHPRADDVDVQRMRSPSGKLPCRQSARWSRHILPPASCVWHPRRRSASIPR